jgi:hypothetical protein
MKQRIAIWVMLGILAAAFWGIFFLLIRPADPLVWNLARLSCPIVIVGHYLNFGVRLYWVLATNAVIYAVVGLVVEGLLRTHKLPHPLALFE